MAGSNKKPYTVKTTFIIPSIGRDTLKRAVQSVRGNRYLYKIDADRKGAGETRNELIQQAKTPWVSFLDDDDTVTEDYVQRLEEEINAHPDADVIHFREYFLTGQVFPNWPKIEWGNVGISFSVKRDVALKNPFKSEEYEDYEFVKRLEEKGYKIYYSPYLVYRARH